MEGNNKIQYLIQSGAIGICLCLLVLWGEQAKRNDVLISNHINHSTQAMIQNTAAFVGLKETIENSDENSNKIIEQNTDAIESLEEAILFKR